jgi:CO/xanthine dehydrogenase FAD-binding subunit
VAESARPGEVSSRWRIVANSVAPTVRRCPSIEHLLDSAAPISSPAGLLPAIRADVAPIDDLRSSAAYREQVLARVIYHSLRGVAPSVT